MIFFVKLNLRTRTRGPDFATGLLLLVANFVNFGPSALIMGNTKIRFNMLVGKELFILVKVS